MDPHMVWGMRILPSPSASRVVTLIAKCRPQNSWPTTEQGANGIVYFSGLPPPQPTRPQPTAVHLQTPPRKSADRPSPRVRSLREHSDGSVSPSKRTGAHMRAADPLSLVSSPLGLSHRLRASISAAEQVHADLMQPLKQEVEEQSPADYQTLDSGGPICKVHGLAVCRACGMDFPVLNSKPGVSAPHDALLTASHASEQNLGKSSVLAESMRADMDLQAQGISGFRPTESSPAIEIPLNSDAVPASNADEWHSTQARVTITVGAARLPSRLLQALMTEGSCKMRVILSVCTENSDANHAGEAITVESSQPYFGHTFPLHLSALMHKVNVRVCLRACCARVKLTCEERAGFVRVHLPNRFHTATTAYRLFAPTC